MPASPEDLGRVLDILDIFSARLISVNINVNDHQTFLLCLGKWMNKQ